MAQTLTTTILINAKTGSGFTEVGNTLTELGSVVSGISDQLIGFGRDSVNVYREYEKSMKDAEVALSTTYGRSTRELTGVMSQIDAAATEWAATTIFHTDDVANAIAEAAHAGWDLDQIMAGIPAAMELAQAGSLDLSEAVNYIVKSTNAAGIEFEDIGTFIDHWAFVANSSATNIDELGEAMLRMGGTMKFAKNTDELLTMLAVLADTGYTGSSAGTLLRNSMIRLVAPTKSAKEAMTQLGATSEETAALLNDSELAAANARLAAQGFSLYDEDGNMKSMLDTYRDLYVALGEIAGGYEDIERNEDATSILSAIFPQRSITGALALLEAASTGYNGLYETLRNGDASDYGEYAAATMMDTLFGRMETFDSKVERLKQSVGEEMAPTVGQALESIGGIVDKIVDMDEGKFGALVGGLEVIAGAGSGLLLAGAAMRLIGLALTPAGGFGLGLLAVTAAVKSIKELEESDLASKFGDMNLDTEGIQNYVQSIGKDFESAYKNVNDFKTALSESVTNYETASETFSGKLFEDMLTNVKLTEQDKSELTNLGNDMYLAVQEAIANSASASQSYWEMLFGGEGVAEADPAYQELMGLTNEAYEAAIAQAESIGQGLRNALTSAFEDGEIDESEYNNILSYMRSYNEAIAKAAEEAQEEEAQIKLKTLMRQAQTASLEDLEGILEANEAERESTLQAVDDAYNYERSKAEVRGASDDTLQAIDEKYRQHRGGVSSRYDEVPYAAFDSQIRNSELGDAYRALETYAGQYMSGILSPEAIENILYEQMGASKYAGQKHLGGATVREQLGKMMGHFINSYGGQEGIEESINWYRENGNTAMANQLGRIYTMEQLINGFGTSKVTNGDWREFFADEFSTSNQIAHEGYQANRASFEQTVQPDTSAYSAAAAAEAVKAYEPLSNLFRSVEQAINGDEWSFMDQMGAINSSYGVEGTIGEDVANLVSTLSQNYDIPQVIADTISSMPKEWAGEGNESYRDMYGMYQLMYGEASGNAEDYRIKVTPEVDTSAIGEFDPVPLPIEPRVEETDAAEQLQQQGVTVDVDGDTQSLEATIDGADGQTLLEYVDGDASNLSMKISDQDGKTLVENVTGNTASLAAAINAYNGKTITVNIAGNRLFASGGRATAASIFGEAGPEWAIPEEHSERTAQLLDAAREASGFTWPDLLSRVGGLNANPGHTPPTVIYSPTINAADATGVEQVLADDKRRFEKWWEDKQMRDQVEVYQ